MIDKELLEKAWVGFKRQNPTGTQERFAKEMDDAVRSLLSAISWGYIVYDEEGRPC